MVLRIGLTGGIGSGKTTVAKIFETLGIPVYYADDAAKRLMNENEDLRKKLINHFGEGIYNNRELNRQKLSEIVFGNDEKLNLLNSLVHPLTIADADEWMQQQTTPYIIKEAALIFETDVWKYLDKVIGVSAPYELRMQRTMLRDNRSALQVKAKMSKQMEEEEKMSRCDYIIYNNEKELLIPQVIALHEKLIAKNM